MKCTFFGHADAPESCEAKLIRVIEGLIEKNRPQSAEGR